MKIFGAIPDVGSIKLSNFDVTRARWSLSVTDTEGYANRAIAEVDEKNIDWIGSRYAREDGDWKQEVVLFPGVEVAIERVC